MEGGRKGDGAEAVSVGATGSACDPTTEPVADGTACGCGVGVGISMKSGMSDVVGGWATGTGALWILLCCAGTTEGGEMGSVVCCEMGAGWVFHSTVVAWEIGSGKGDGAGAGAGADACCSGT